MSAKENLIPSSEIKGLIFDLDGTLADTMPLHIDAWKQTGAHYDVTITPKMIEDRAGTPTIEVIQQLNELFGWKINPMEFRLKKNEIYIGLKKKAGKITPIQHIVDIAQRYKETLPMSIGTGSIRRNASLALEDLGIADWFQIMITADDVTDPKPHPETFLNCADHMKINPKDCLVYEDGPPGIEAALAAGMTAVHVDTFKIYRP